MRTYRQIFVYDPRIGYKFLANLKVTILGDDKDNMEDYKLVIDKYGYRNNLDDFLFDNSKFGVDNLFIGCSFTAGDGIVNELRFSNLIGNSYNAGLSGSCNIQQLSIAEDCSRFLIPKRLIFSPYIGCLSRNELPCRSSDFLFTRHKWHKPYFEIKDHKIFIRNLPVPQPSLDLNSELSQISKISFKNLYKDFIYPKIFPERFRINELIKPYKSNMHFNLCKKLYINAKNLFPNSRFILSPIPHLEFLKYANSYEKNLITNFYNSLSKEIDYEYFDLISLMKRTSYEDLYYLIDGHLNKKGHLFLSESFKNLFMKK